MLQSIRDKIQGWVAGSIVMLIALTFALWGVQNFRSGQGQAVAKVNGVEIMQRRLRTAYDQAKQAKRARLGLRALTDPQAQAELRHEVLQRLIEGQVLFQAQKKLGMGVGSTELRMLVGFLPMFRVDGHFSLEAFRQVVQSSFGSEEDFWNELESNVLKGQFEWGVESSGFVLANELELSRNILKQRRDFSYLLVPYNYFANKVQVEPQEIKEYYDTHRADFLLSEQVRLEYLELNSEDLRKRLSAETKDFVDFYRNNISMFSTPKRWQVTKICYPGIQRQTSLPTQVAATLEQAKAQLKGQSTQPKQGVKLDPKLKIETLWVSAQDRNPELLARLENLQNGEFSPHFYTKDGVNLVKIESLEPSQPIPYEQVATKVRERYLAQQLTQNFSDMHDRLTDLAYVNPDSLSSVAQELGLSIQTSGWLTKDQQGSGILANPKVVRAAFSDPVLQQRYNSGPIELESGRVLVLRIKEHIPEKVLPLEKVAAQIVKQLQQHKQRVAAEQLAHQIKEQIQAGQAPEQIARQHHLNWQPVKESSYGQTTPNPQLVDTAFRLPQAQSEKISVETVELKDGYGVVCLEKVYEVRQVLPAVRSKKAEAVLLANQYGKLDYQNFIETLMQKAKIKVVDLTARNPGEVDD